MTKSDSNEQSIEVLTQRFQKLHTRKTQAETLRDEARRQVDKLKTEAREKYGTDDIAALQVKLADMIAENTRRRTEYQAELDAIERGLAEVEKKSTSGGGVSPSSAPTANTEVPR